MLETGFRSLGLTTATVWLATLASVAALAVVAAYWTWAWLAPRAEPAAPAPVPAVARLDAARGLFGSVRANRVSAAPSASASSFRLLGLVAASGHEPGYALLKLDGKWTLAVRPGMEIEPGTRLVEVNADHVVLDRHGMRETLALPSRGKDAAKAAVHAR